MRRAVAEFGEGLRTPCRLSAAVSLCVALGLVGAAEGWAAGGAPWRLRPPALFASADDAVTHVWYRLEEAKDHGAARRVVVLGSSGFRFALERRDLSPDLSAALGGEADLVDLTFAQSGLLESLGLLERLGDFEGLVCVGISPFRLLDPPDRFRLPEATPGVLRLLEPEGPGPRLSSPFALRREGPWLRRLVIGPARRAVLGVPLPLRTDALDWVVPVAPERFTSGPDEALAAARLRAYLVPGGEERLAANLRVLEALLDRCDASPRVRPVLVVQPMRPALAQVLPRSEFAPLFADYQRTVAALCARRGVPLLDPSRAAALTDADFLDRGHVGKEPARARFTRALIAGLAELAGAPRGR